MVSGKKYFSYTKGDKKSRPINQDLYLKNSYLFEKFWWLAVRKNNFTILSPEEITKICYTIAINFCSIIDIEKDDDKKTPGTFFEYFISFLIGRKLNISPKKDIEILNMDLRSKLTIDFYYDPGINKPKYHPPVKTSTRERVIQVWAHQRVLDGIYGMGRFFGIPVILTETKLDSKKLEVIEICVPEQWRIYQMFISQLKRVYYLDMPDNYKELNKVYPKISVKQFGEFFHEIEALSD